MSLEPTNPTVSTEKGPEIQSHRACQHCRAQKVRCMIDDDEDTCERCARAGRTCVFTPLQKRKQRKRTDARVAELEKEMKQMRAALQKDKSNGGYQGNTTASTGAGVKQAPVCANDIPQQAIVADRRNKSSNVQQSSGAAALASSAHDTARPPQLWPSKFADRPLDGMRDVIEYGILSLDTARQLFETYRRDLYPNYPLVLIPPSVTADELRSTKPTLFLATIAAAAGKENSDLSAILDNEVLLAYAERHLIHSEKSLELVQALLLSAVWYHPPTRFGQLKYNEYMSMAATMSLDLGIASRPVAHRNLLGSRPKPAQIHPLEDATNPDLSMSSRSRNQSPDTGSLESRRTFLACFVACSGVALSLRRPCFLRVNSYIRECIGYMDSAPNLEALDRTLVAWARLMLIAEEICAAFCYDDPGRIASIGEFRTQLMLKDFEQRLTKWFSSTPEQDLTNPLAMQYYSVRMYLHEVALHVDHTPQDFTAPFHMGPVHGSAGDDVPTETLAAAIAECITSAHSLMKTFINTDPDVARGFPVFAYLRISYAAFVLAKLCLSASHSASRIGKILDRSQLKVEMCLDRAILHVRAVVGSVRCRLPAIFLAMLFKLRQWCLDPHLLERSKASSTENPNHASGQTTGGQVSGIGSRGRPGAAGTAQGEDGQTLRVPSKSRQYESLDKYFEETTPEMDASLSESASISRQAPTEYPNQDHAQSGASVAAFLPPAEPMVYQPFQGGEVSDQMELDRDFLQFFEDVNAHSQAGLTGLGDWSSVPADYPYLPENFDWQAAAAMYNGTTLM